MSYVGAFKKPELKKLLRGPMWPEAAKKELGYGDPDLERAEAAGLIVRTEQGFILTAAGRDALQQSGGPKCD